MMLRRDCIDVTLPNHNAEVGIYSSIACGLPTRVTLVIDNQRLIHPSLGIGSREAIACGSQILPLVHRLYIDGMAMIQWS